MSSVVFTFGELEAALAEMHDVADSKRTKFQSRLKNFHRLRFPLSFETSKGKTAKYGPGHIAEMALAVELTQLGLPPERTVRVLALNWYPTAMAISMAARALLERPEGFDEKEVKDTDPLSMFLFFDPAALAPLMFDHDPDLTPDLDQASDTFFYGGEAVVQDNIVKWTSGPINRVSLINVTAMLDRLARVPFSTDSARSLDWRARFFSELRTWAETRSEGFAHADQAQADFIFRFVASYYKAPTNKTERATMERLLEAYFGLDEAVIHEGVGDFMRESGTLK